MVFILTLCNRSIWLRFGRCWKSSKKFTHLKFKSKLSTSLIRGWTSIDRFFLCLFAYFCCISCAVHVFLLFFFFQIFNEAAKPRFIAIMELIHTQRLPCKQENGYINCAYNKNLAMWIWWREKKNHLQNKTRAYNIV